MHRFLRRFSSVLSEMQSTKRQDYAGAIEALNGLQSNSQYIKLAKVKNNQENNLSEMVKFLNRSGVSLEQFDRLRVVHIAGTKGKGTTCAYCESILRGHGLKTGFFSSPHLLEVRERIRVNGKPISKEVFAANFWNIYNSLDKAKSTSWDMPLYFRFLTIMALHVFLKNEVDVAILEVGIGGEYDCTNVIRNTVVAGITPLDIDHTSLLGNTIESIAWNKGGIFKPNSVAFTVQQTEEAMKVLKERSIERNCKLEIVENCYNDTQNNNTPFQVKKINASLALAVSKAFIEKTCNKKFSVNLAKEAIESTYWVGRYEIFHIGNLTIYLDGAHTLQSLKVCADWFKSKTERSNSKKCLIFNLIGDRNAEILMRILTQLKFDLVFFVPNVGTESDNPGTNNTNFVFTSEEQIARCEKNKEKWKDLVGFSEQTVGVLPSVSRVFKFLGQEEKYDVLITGSIHLIGAAMQVLDPSLRGTLNE